jgi:hypothetical protein
MVEAGVRCWSEVPEPVSRTRVTPSAEVEPPEVRIPRKLSEPGPRLLAQLLGRRRLGDIGICQLADVPISGALYNIISTPRPDVTASREVRGTWSTDYVE